MRKTIFAFAIAAALSTSACVSTQSVLLAGIPADAISDKAADAALAGGAAGTGVSVPGIPGVVTLTPEMTLAADAIRASGANPVCGQFNMNSLVAVSNPTSGKVPGLGILKVIAVGALSGVAGGLVPELGIESKFVERAVSGTVSQVAFNTAKPIIDGVLPSGQEVDTISKINETAGRLNCPPPSWAGTLSPKDAKTLLAYLTAEFKAATPSE